MASSGKENDGVEYCSLHPSTRSEKKVCFKANKADKIPGQGDEYLECRSSSMLCV